MAAPDEVAVHVRVDEHAGTPGEEAHLTEGEEAHLKEGEDDVVLNKLAEGIFGLLGPAVNEIDDRVADVRKSQTDLKEQVDRLHDELKHIAEQKEVPHTLESYILKLSNCRRRMHLVNELLKNIQERLNKLQQNVAKETSRRRVSLESNSYLSN